MQTENMIPTTAGRVPQHTADEFNEQIRTETLNRIDLIGYDKELLEGRLVEIEKEWDVERR